MDSMTLRPIKPRLLAFIEKGQDEQQAFIAQLGEAERAAIGEPDAWVAKDHIAHNIAWKADAVREITTTLQGEVYTVLSITVFNPRVFAEQQHQSWDAILADGMQADEALRTALETCSEADLSDPTRFPWREGFPLWTTVFVSTYDHPSEHYAQFYLESGNVARASAVREKAINTARRLIGDTQAFGYIVYNLGCFYAQTGQHDLALTTLREAFARVPDLRAGSMKDPELALLHNDPAFQALVAETADAAEVGTSTD